MGLWFAEYVYVLFSVGYKFCFVIFFIYFVPHLGDAREGHRRPRNVPKASSLRIRRRPVLSTGDATFSPSPSKAMPVKKSEKKRESVVGVKNANASIKEEREDAAVVESSSVDAEVDDFINRFKKQLQLLRNDSILRYKDLISAKSQPEPSRVSSGESMPQVSPGRSNSKSNTKPTRDKSNNGVKSSVDDFINKFKKQLLSQRNASISRYKNMFSRISATTQSGRGAKTMGGGMEMELRGVTDEVVVCDKSSRKRDSVPLMGTSNQAKDLITELLQDGSSLGSEIYVAAIVGIGASGKATLRQILFNAAKKSSIFSFKAWISVGEVFDVLHITRSILMSSGYCFKSNACNDLTVLQRDLLKMVTGKRFLIILEDIGTINLEASWDNLLLSLQSAAKGSFIILTVNNEEVVDIIHPVSTFHSLQPFINAFFDSDSITKLSPAQQYVLKNSSCELDRLVDNFDSGVSKGKQKEVLSTSRFIKEAGLSFSALNQFVSRLTYDLEDKVFKEILSDIIRRDHVQFGSTAIIPSTNQTVTWSAQTSGSHIITHAVIRRDQVRNYIVSKLSDKSMASETLSISPIVGTGGAGNNTLFLLFACIRDLNLWQMMLQDSRLESFWKTTNLIGSRDWTRIEKMKQRRSLFIFELENVNTEADALAYNLQSEEYLEELVLEWSASSDDPKKARTVLTALKPHKTLTRLTINNYPGTSLPQWVTDSAFYCLRTLQLNNCSNCISLPSLGELPSLVYLSIKNFHSLQIVGPEFYGVISSQSTPFGTLKTLHFENLLEWQIWVNDEVEGRVFPNLQELSLIECSQLVGKLPAELPSLRKLEILDCEQLNILPPKLPQLATLKLQKCELLDFAVTNFSSLTSLDVSFEGENNTFVPNLENLTSLSYLRIAGLNNLCTFNELKLPSTLETLFISQPVDILTSPLSSFYNSVDLLPSLHVLRLVPSSLTSLSIGGFKDLDLPQHSYMSLQYLSIHDCHLSEPLHFPLGSFLMLEFLEIKNCFHLESFDITSSSGHEICLPFLNELSIDNCPNLLSFPGEGFAALNLKTLSITNCKNLLSLPEDMHTCMTSLLSLSLEDCPDLDSFPKGCLPSSLQSLHIRYCKRLTSNWKHWKLEQLVSLTQLEIQGCEEVECFPPQGWLPASLTTLVIAHFPALVFLIGEALQQLTSLQELQIMYCQELLSLPEAGLPPSLEYLGIHFCPLVKERCQKDEGEDWPKISDIPHVFIDCQEM